MAAIMLLLKCLTNLHVGNGETNYNIIDNEVERDPVTNYPTINASGVKGALRAYLSRQVKKTREEQEEWNGKIELWLGAEKGRQAGMLKILNASMLAMPMRVTEGDQPYQLIYTAEMKRQYQEMTEIFGISDGFQENVSDETVNVQVEGYQLEKESVFGVKNVQLSWKFYCMEEEQFKRCALPVIARNCLDNGKSVNLWYEEVVPHKSIFYIPVIANEKDRGLLDDFKKAVDGKVIQFGGNASIGYGLCKIFVEEGEHE